MPGIARIALRIVLLATVTVATNIPAAGAVAPSYVALGDSYTAAPGVQPVDPAAPSLCLRSSANYPHLTAAALRLSLTDRSCSGATTADLGTAQYPDQPPQFGALRPSTAVVTIGIGGNDNQLFVSAVAACSITDVLDLLNLGAPCRTAFGDFFVNEAKNDGPLVGQALATIHALAPAAQVFVIGYPDILPQRGSCYPQLPLTTGDVAYLNQLELTLNGVLQRAAAGHGATFVDTYTASVGHDACKSEAVRWIEPLLPGTPGSFPIHPNARGEAADARSVEAALRAAGN